MDGREGGKGLWNGEKETRECASVDSWAVARAAFPSPSTKWICRRPVDFPSPEIIDPSSTFSILSLSLSFLIVHVYVQFHVSRPEP